VVPCSIISIHRSNRGWALQPLVLLQSKGNRRAWYRQFSEVLEHMSTVKKWKSWLGRVGYPEMPRAERRIPSGFAARRASHPDSQPATIRDISSTGLYLLTPERWPLGELIPLTVQVEGLPEMSPGPQFAVEARVVRHGDDGIGLSFVLPTGLDPNLWGALVANSVVLTEPKDILFTLRMLRTILFLCRLCHAEADEAILLLGGELDQTRTEAAFEIAHGAEELLASEPGAGSMRTHPKLAAGILKYGSWSSDDLTKQLWTGLLASSCTVDGTGESNLEFMDLLVNLTPIQSLIFLTGCKKALERMSKTGDLPPARIVFTPQEMSQLTGIFDPSRIAMEIAYLFNAGLIDKVFDFSSYIPTESFDITPSRLGLQLYKLCKGHLIQPHSPLREPAQRSPFSS